MKHVRKIYLEKLLNRTLSLPARAQDSTYEEAIRLTRFAIRACPHEPFLYFYLATFHSAINEVGKSLFYFEEALKRGFCDWPLIHSDPSFANTRDTPGFVSIVSTYTRPSQPTG